MQGLHDDNTPQTDAVPVVYTRPAPGSVQTIQLTSKRWKGLMLVALSLMLAGISVGGWLIVREPRTLSHPSWSMIAAVSTFVAGIVLLIVARIGAWWHHG